MHARTAHFLDKYRARLLSGIGLLVALLLLVVFAGWEGAAKPSRDVQQAARAGVAESGDGAVQLIMFEQWGCEYCELWHEEIGEVYNKTSEGKFAPLKTAHYGEAEAKFGIRGVVYTPTFVVTRQGREFGRIVGYPGEDFFWQQLDSILRKLGYDPEDGATESTAQQAEGAAPSSPPT